jgi:flagellar basal body rod protein FlgB
MAAVFAGRFLPVGAFRTDKETAVIAENQRSDLACFLRLHRQHAGDHPMSLFGALNTVVSGLSAQSVAFGNISDNVANSQTVGYKGVNTNFIDYLTTSTNAQNNPGAVTTRPDYTNSVQGTITSSSDPTAMAIAGQGFFAVSETDGTTAGGQPTFSQQSYYTRAGDFSMDKNGYLVNSAGDYLNGWNVDPTTGIANQSQLVPIQVNQAQFQPVPTDHAYADVELDADRAERLDSQYNVAGCRGRNGRHGGSEVRRCQRQRRGGWNHRRLRHVDRRDNGHGVRGGRGRGADAESRFRAGAAEHPTRSGHFRDVERPQPICRHELQPAWIKPERCARG